MKINFMFDDPISLIFDADKLEGDERLWVF